MQCNILSEVLIKCSTLTVVAIPLTEISVIFFAIDKNQPTSYCDQEIKEGLYVSIGVSAALLLIMIATIVIFIFGCCCISRRVKDNHKDLKYTVQESYDGVKSSVKGLDTNLTEVKGLLQQLVTDRRQINRIQGDCVACEMEPTKESELEEFDQAFAEFISESFLMALKNPQLCDVVKRSVGETIRELLLDSE